MHFGKTERNKFLFRAGKAEAAVTRCRLMSNTRNVSGSIYVASKQVIKKRRSKQASNAMQYIRFYLKWRESEQKNIYKFFYSPVITHFIIKKYFMLLNVQYKIDFYYLLR
jgi:hypothetical protein